MKNQNHQINTPAKAVRVATAVKSTTSKSKGRGGRGQGGGKASRAKGGSFGGKKVSLQEVLSLQDQEDKAVERQAELKEVAWW